MTERIVPFSELEPKDKGLIKRINWTITTRNGNVIEDWSAVSDPKYGTVRHVAVIDDERSIAFDKINLEWGPAAFVVVFRRRDDRVEFLLPNERRILLKDENGNQGNVFIRNIPQGLIRASEGETSHEAALREVKEETGLDPIKLVELGEIYFDAANSSTAMPFFLAEIDSNRLQEYAQNLDESEEIRVGEDDWFTLEDIPQLKLQCAKTLSSLMLATGYFRHLAASE